MTAHGGIGIELTDDTVRGVHVDGATGRVIATGELSFRPGDDDGLLDALVMLNAELGEPGDRTRLATFPTGAMLQRVDITGMPDAEVTAIVEHAQIERGIRSSVVTADGPRRWLLLVRWDEPRIEQVAALGGRAGFVDVSIEPTPMSIGRVVGADATFVRRFASRNDAHHCVLHNRVPVAATSAPSTAHTQPGIRIGRGPVVVAVFEELMDDAALVESIDRAVARSGVAGADDPSLADLEASGGLDVSALRRFVVALGAAVAAAGLTAPVDSIRVVGPSAGIGGDPFDRPWAIEAIPPGDDGPHVDATHAIERVTRWFRPRRPR